LNDAKDVRSWRSETGGVAVCFRSSGFIKEFETFVLAASKGFVGVIAIVIVSILAVPAGFNIVLL
jgi:hypothetical protein